MQIQETENKAINLRGWRMTNDIEMPDLEKPLPSYGFCIGLIGPPRSGKSNLLLNLINKPGKCYYGRFDNVHIWSPSVHTIEATIHLPQEKFHANLDMEHLQKEIDKLEGTELRSLFVFDDCIAAVKKDMPTFLRMVLNRRHIGGSVSIILVSQVLNRCPLEIRKCFSHVAFFANRNHQEQKCLREEMTDLSAEQFRVLYRYVFEKPHDFLWIDLQTGEYFKNFNKLNLIFSE